MLLDVMVSCEKLAVLGYKTASQSVVLKLTPWSSTACESININEESLLRLLREYKQARLHREQVISC